MGCEPAFCTKEKSLRLSVFLGYESTSRASTARIAGIYRKYGHSFPLGFVFEKVPQLIKRPLPESLSLRFGNRFPAIEAFQVFDNDCSAGVFSRRDDFFADYVIRLF